MPIIELKVAVTCEEKLVHPDGTAFTEDEIAQAIRTEVELTLEDALLEGWKTEVKLL